MDSQDQKLEALQKQSQQLPADIVNTQGNNNNLVRQVRTSCFLLLKHECFSQFSLIIYTQAIIYIIQGLIMIQGKIVEQQEKKLLVIKYIIIGFLIGFLELLVLQINLKIQRRHNTNDNSKQVWSIVFAIVFQNYLIFEGATSDLQSNMVALCLLTMRNYKYLQQTLKQDKFKISMFLIAFSTLVIRYQIYLKLDIGQLILSLCIALVVLINYKKSQQSQCNLSLSQFHKQQFQSENVCSIDPDSSSNKIKTQSFDQLRQERTFFESTQLTYLLRETNCIGIVIVKEDRNLFFANNYIKNILQCDDESIISTFYNTVVEQVVHYSPLFLGQKSPYHQPKNNRIQRQSLKEQLLTGFNPSVNHIKYKPQDCQEDNLNIFCHISKGTMTIEKIVFTLIDILLNSKTNLKRRSANTNEIVTNLSSKNIFNFQINTLKSIQTNQVIDSGVVSITFRVGHRLMLCQLKLQQCKLQSQPHISPEKHNSANAIKERNVIISFYIQEISDLAKHLQSNNEKQYRRQFLTSIQHELRTPLNCSQNMLNMLMSHEELSTQIKNQLIFPALCSSELLRNYINDLSDYAQIEMGDFTLNLSDFDLFDMLNQCLILFQVQAQMKDISLNVTYDEQIPKYIRSDPNRIKQIIINLLSNALKYTKQGHITINVILVKQNQLTSKNDQQQQHQDDIISNIINTTNQLQTIQISVQDTGIGIQKHMLDNLQETFCSNKSSGRGSSFKSSNRFAGLGLTICAHIARALCKDKHIEIISDVGKGSKFKFFVHNYSRQSQALDPQHIFNILSSEFARYFLQLNQSMDNLEHEQMLSSKNSFFSNQFFSQENFRNKSKKPTLISYNFNKQSSSGNSNNWLTVQESQQKLIRSQNQTINEQSYSHSLIMNEDLPNNKLQTFQTKLKSRNKYLDSLSEQILEEITQEKNQQGSESTIKQQDKPQIKRETTTATRATAATTTATSITTIKDIQQQQSIKKISSDKEYKVKQSPPSLINGFNNLETKKMVTCNCTQILIADDDQFNIFVLENMLKLYNISSDSAFNGQHAIEQVQQRLYHSTCCKTYTLIFMDIDMPQKNGFEATQEILSLFNNKEEKPIVCACTAYLSGVEQKEAIKLGIKKYLPKPIVKQTLDEILNELFSLPFQSSSKQHDAILSELLLQPLFAHPLPLRKQQYQIMQYIFFPIKYGKLSRETAAAKATTPKQVTTNNNQSNNKKTGIIHRFFRQYIIKYFLDLFSCCESLLIVALGFIITLKGFINFNLDTSSSVSMKHILYGLIVMILELFHILFFRCFQIRKSSLNSSSVLQQQQQDKLNCQDELVLKSNPLKIYKICAIINFSVSNILLTEVIILDSPYNIWYIIAVVIKNLGFYHHFYKFCIYKFKKLPIVFFYIYFIVRYQFSVSFEAYQFALSLLYLFFFYGRRYYNQQRVDLINMKSNEMQTKQIIINNNNKNDNKEDQLSYNSEKKIIEDNYQRKFNQMYEHILNNIKVGVLILDYQQNLIFSNSFIENIIDCQDNENLLEVIDKELIISKKKQKKFQDAINPGYSNIDNPEKEYSVDVNAQKMNDNATIKQKQFCDVQAKLNKIKTEQILHVQQTLNSNQISNGGQQRDQQDLSFCSLIRQMLYTKVSSNVIRNSNGSLQDKNFNNNNNKRVSIFNNNNNNSIGNDQSSNNPQQPKAALDSKQLSTQQMQFGFKAEINNKKYDIEIQFQEFSIPINEEHQLSTPLINASNLMVNKVIIIKFYEISTKEIYYSKKLKQIEQFYQKLFTSLAHEIRTPLNCSLNILDVLMHSEQISSQIKNNYVYIALCSNELLRNIANDIYDYSSLQNNQFQLEIIEFNLRDILNNCLMIFLQQAKLKGLELSLKYSKSIPDKINSDPNRIKQLVLNLISNALKFTRFGHITIKVTNEYESMNDLQSMKSPIDQHQKIIKISVIDTGIGISKNYTDLIKENFAKINQHPSSYMSTRGQGLGLSICSHLAKYICGSRKMEIESVETEGSTFSFYVYNHKQESQLKYQSSSQIHLQRDFSKWSNYQSVNDFIRQEDSQDDEQKKSQSVDRDLESVQKQFKFEKKKSLYFDSDKSSDNSNQQSHSSIQMEIDNSPSKINYKKKPLSKSCLEDSDEEIAPNYTLGGNNVTKTKKKYKFQEDFNAQLSSQVSKASNGQDEEKQSSFMKVSSNLTQSLYNQNQKCNCSQVLIVDDEQFNLYVMKKMINDQKVSVDTCLNGQEAVDKVIQKFNNSHECCKQYKIIFMDIDMPIKDGYQASKEIIEFFKQKSMVQYICACTANSTPTEKQKAYQVGMKNFIVKPINNQILEAIISDIVLNPQQQQQSEKQKQDF